MPVKSSPVKSKRTGPLVIALAGLWLAGCKNQPPSPGLRFEPTDPSGWSREADGRLRSACGPAVLWVDLHKTETRIELTVENNSGQPLTLKVGAESSSPTAAIGELWRRPIGSKSGEDVPEAVPYKAHQEAELRSGWRAVFYLDSPLGRDLVLGQFFLFTIDVGAGAIRERRTLALMATNVPPPPARH